MEQSKEQVLNGKASRFPGGPVAETLPFRAGAVSSTPGWEPKIPHASGSKNQNITQKQYCSRFNKDFKK